MNTASRMESTSEKNRIHMSDIAANLLRKQAPQMQLEQREKISIKGKGKMQTYWLLATSPALLSTPSLPSAAAAAATEQLQQLRHSADATGHDDGDGQGDTAAAVATEASTPAVQEPKASDGEVPAATAASATNAAPMATTTTPAANAPEDSRVDVNASSNRRKGSSKSKKKHRQVNFSDITEHRRISAFSETSTDGEDGEESTDSDGLGGWMGNPQQNLRGLSPDGKDVFPGAPVRRRQLDNGGAGPANVARENGAANGNVLSLVSDMVRQKGRTAGARSPRVHPTADGHANSDGTASANASAATAAMGAGEQSQLSPDAVVLSGSQLLHHSKDLSRHSSRSSRSSDAPPPAHPFAASSASIALHDSSYLDGVDL